MDCYSVVIPYSEPDGRHPDRVYEATIEVTARSPAEAKLLATREFRNLTELSWVRGRREIVRDRITVERGRPAEEKPLRLEAGEVAPGILSLEVSGKLDAETEKDFREKLRGLASGEHRRLVLNLAGLEYINSTSIGEIAAAMGQLELRLAAAQPGVLRVLKIVGLDKAIQCFNSVEEAAASFT